MKKALSLILALVMCLSLFPMTALAEQTAIKVWLDGTEIAFDQPPIVENGRTLVPMRAIFEAMGATVEWDGETQTVTGTKDNTIIILQIGNAAMTKNGQSITLDVPPKAVNNRTLVPVRAVAESFDAAVEWNGETNTVVITSTGAAVDPSSYPTMEGVTPPIPDFTAITGIPIEEVGSTGSNVGKGSFYFSFDKTDIKNKEVELQKYFDVLYAAGFRKGYLSFKSLEIIESTDGPLVKDEKGHYPTLIHHDYKLQLVPNIANGDLIIHNIDYKGLSAPDTGHPLYEGYPVPDFGAVLGVGLDYSDNTLGILAYYYPLEYEKYTGHASGFLNGFSAYEAYEALRDSYLDILKECGFVEHVKKSLGGDYLSYWEGYGYYVLVSYQTYERTAKKPQLKVTIGTLK